MITRRRILFLMFACARVLVQAGPTPTQPMPNMQMHINPIDARADPSTTVAPPFFAGPSDLTPPPKPAEEAKKPSLTKTVFAYIFLVAGVLLVICLLLRRLMLIRAQNRPFYHVLFSTRSRPTAPTMPRTSSRTTEGYIDPGYPYYPSHLPRPLRAYFLRNSRTTHAADVDAAGRRDAGQQLNDHDGPLTDKDILPAYDTYGGPPTYADIAMRSTRTCDVGSGDISSIPVGESDPRSGNTQSVEHERQPSQEAQDRPSDLAPSQPMISAAPAPEVRADVADESPPNNERTDAHSANNSDNSTQRSGQSSL